MGLWTVKSRIGKVKDAVSDDLSSFLHFSVPDEVVR